MSGLTMSGWRLCSTHVAHPPLPGRAVPGRSVDDSSVKRFSEADEIGRGTFSGAMTCNMTI
jgi:hypothetical protein